MWARACVCMVVCEQRGSRLVRGRHRMCMCLIAVCHTSQIASITLVLYDRKRATQKCPCQEQCGEAWRWRDTEAEGAHASRSCHARSSSSPSRILRCWSLSLSGEEHVSHLKPLPHLLVTSVLAEAQETTSLTTSTQTEVSLDLNDSSTREIWRLHGIGTTHSSNLPFARQHVCEPLKTCESSTYVG